MISTIILWVIYIVTVLIIFIAGYWTLDAIRGRYPTTGCATILFIALIIGLLVVLILAPLMDDVDTKKEKNVLSYLFGVSFLLPVIVFLLVVWNGEHCSYSYENIIIEDRYKCDPITNKCYIIEKNIKRTI